MSQRTDDPGLMTEPTPAVAPVGTIGPATDRRRGFRKRPRQTRVVIRKVGPWSVFKFSILFYFCIMLVILLALGMLYSVLGAVGALDSVTKLARELFSDKTFTIHGDWIFQRLALLGVAMVLIWSLINVFVAFLYNLISDVVGGIEVTLAERR
ncbi:MAG: DUF3566 domain-containing protein [Actinomycetota bacterium]